MKLLVGPVSVEEASMLLHSGVGILDVKNVIEGSYGAAPPGTIRAVSRIAGRSGKVVSATLGDLECQPGTAGLAAFGAVMAGATMLKVGLRGPRTPEAAVAVLRSIAAAAKDASLGPTAVFAGGYADAASFGGLAPIQLVDAAMNAGVTGVMLDTHSKTAGSLFQALPLEDLHEFVRQARAAALDVVLAGSLTPEHIPSLLQLQPDVVGIRGSACVNGDRRLGLDVNRVKAWTDSLSAQEPNEEAA